MALTPVAPQSYRTHDNTCERRAPRDSDTGLPMAATL